MGAVVCRRSGLRRLSRVVTTGLRLGPVLFACLAAAPAFPQGEDGAGKRSAGDFLTGLVVQHYHETIDGVLLHESCAAAPGLEWLAQQIHESLEQGLGCLEDLESGQIDAPPHARRLRRLLARQTDILERPKVICHAPASLFDASVGAYAMVASYQPKHVLFLTTARFGRETVQHPLIAIPHGLSPDQLPDFQSAFFHELFHSLGYGHGGDTEYAYACEAACFAAGDLSRGRLQVARRLCTRPEGFERGPPYEREVRGVLRALGYSRAQARAVVGP